VIGLGLLERLVHDRNSLAERESFPSGLGGRDSVDRLRARRDVTAGIHDEHGAVSESTRIRANEGYLNRQVRACVNSGRLQIEPE